MCFCPSWPLGRKWCVFVPPNANRCSPILLLCTKHGYTICDISARVCINCFIKHPWRHTAATQRRTNRHTNRRWIQHYASSVEKSFQSRSGSQGSRTVFRNPPAVHNGRMHWSCTAPERRQLPRCGVISCEAVRDVFPSGGVSSRQYDQWSAGTWEASGSGSESHRAVLQLWPEYDTIIPLIYVVLVVSVLVFSSQYDCQLAVWPKGTKSFKVPVY